MSPEVLFLSVTGGTLAALVTAIAIVIRTTKTLNAFEQTKECCNTCNCSCEPECHD